MSWLNSKAGRWAPSALVEPGPPSSPSAGVDGTGPWIDDSVTADYAGADITGPWIEEVGSSIAGVDVTGPWING